MIDRTRWAAIGAAIAVTIGGGVITVANATISDGTRAVFVPLTPCRLFDMRPAPDQVGNRATALTTGETHTQPVVGNNGNCSIPGDAVAVAMNVTAVDPTAAGYLTIWPADADQPLASNLNYTAGAPPTPNKVDVKLSAGSPGPAGTPGPAGAPGSPGATGTPGAIGPTGIGVANPGDSNVLVADDPTGSFGTDVSSAVGVDGLVVISHASNGNMFVTHCDQPACTTGSTQTVLTGHTGGTSLAIGADGFPIISGRGPGSALRVTHCDDVACTSSTSSIVDDPANSVGLNSSIAIGSDGLAIVAHNDFTAKNLRLSFCEDIACTTATTRVPDDPADLVGLEPSITIGTDGMAIISHFNDTADALRVTHCGNVTCTVVASFTYDDGADIVGQNPAITIGTDGLAIIAHRNASASALHMTHCTNVACTAATTISADNTADALGTSPSIAVGADGMTVASHFNQSTGRTRVTHCSDVACTVATSVDANVGPGASGASISIGADGVPLLSGFDQAAFALRVIHCSNVFCIPFFRRN